jgi:hypothetical protein
MTLRLVALVFVGIAPLLFAGDNGQQVITLKDSSVIRAQVTEMSGGFYFVKSPALGDMKIPTGEVVSIHNEAAATPSTGAPATNAANPSDPVAPHPTPGAAGLEPLRSALSSKVQDLVSTRDGMKAIMDFSRNPDVKAVMNDPQVMQAIQAGDYNALMQSPAMKALLDNPQTKGLIQSVLGSKPQDAPPETPSPDIPPAPTK